MKVQAKPIDSIRPYPGNPRLNDDAVAAVAESIRRFGFRQPIVVDAEGVVVAGHTRLKAAQKLGLEKVPVHMAADLSAEQVRAYRLADNASAERAEWDFELLPVELEAIAAGGFDPESLGFDPNALARILDPSKADATGPDPGEDRYQEQYGVIVVCEDEAHQQRVFEQLAAAGHQCRVVCT
ncbi:MAG: ParB N-terminal domain-containing protein [Planctomycetota bacterium]